MKDSADDILTLGIDIGGTNTVYGIVDSMGKILVKGKVSTTGHENFAAFIDALYADVAKSMTDVGIDISSLAALGVGAPCMNPQTGVIEGAVDLPWPSPIHLTEELSKIFGIPAGGENDANAAALGEVYYGAGRNLDNFIMLTLGTGVGSAIICDGSLLHGTRGLAGELGHTIIRRGPEARPCSCGRKGCLEMYASARGIVATAEELIQNSRLSSSLRDLESIDAKAIGLAAAADDPIAVETLRKTGKILGEACADFTAFSSPDAIIFFGGVAKSFPLFSEALEESYNANLLWVYKDQVKFLTSSLPEADAAILGTAAVGRSLIDS